MIHIPSIEEKGNLRGVRVLVRSGLNVPRRRNEIIDDFRIITALTTIKFLRDRGARVIIISHIGRDMGESLAGVAARIREDIPLKFVRELMSPATAERIQKMNEGEIIMLENLRQNKGETSNNTEFAKHLASLGECYVNDAFSVSHRDHASITGIPKFIPSYAGLLFSEEVKHLRTALRPPSPFLMILGGAKFGTKIPLIEKYLKIADKVFVGGALANVFFRAKGFETGESLVDEDGINLAKQLVDDPKIIIPWCVVVSSNGQQQEKNASEVQKNEKIVDIGEKNIDELGDIVNDSKYILWNGPLGFYEEGFTRGTEKLLRIIGDSKAETLLGGGDTAALVRKIGCQEKFSFVSTGGGAMLDFLIYGTLPGIEAIQASKRDNK